MREVASRGTLLVALTAAVCTATTARADAAADAATRAAARDLGYSGVDAFQRGDYALAHERFERAYALLRAPSLGLWSARALVKLGRLVEARARYLEVTQLPVSVGDEAVQRRARADAAVDAATLAPRVPELVVTVQGTPGRAISVTIDDMPLPAELWGHARPVDPGRHLVRAVAGDDRAEEEVDLAEGEYKTVALSVKAPGLARDADLSLDRHAATAEPQPQRNAREGHSAGNAGVVRPMAWVALTAGGAGIAVGAIAGVLALSMQTDLVCPNLMCDAGSEAKVDRYNMLRNVSTAGFVGGGILAATGAILLFAVPRPDPAGHAEATVARRVTFVVLPSAVAMGGRF
ncbi:MAG TPA: hypothetical protein VFH68_01375 [Polyangia bacterium]|jgi:hypothetical protein|nr:hypothetical protein [Polyangia bacterium]